MSGYCSNNKDSFRPFITTKVNTIVIPYFDFSILSILAFVIDAIIIQCIIEIIDCNVINNIAVMMFVNSKSGTMKYNQSVWFLTYLFCVSILSYIIEKLVLKYGVVYRYSFSVIGVLVGRFVNNNEKIILP